MQYVHPALLTEDQRELLLMAVAPVPEWERPTLEEMLMLLEEQSWMAFATDGEGVILLERRETARGRRLSVVGFACRRFGPNMRGITDGLRKIAADWECDMIETVCYNRRLAVAIQKMGGALESLTMTLPPASASEG